MSLRQTPLYNSHEQADASFTDFGGWDMPVSFDSIRAEHTAVRNSVGKFDVSHMGEIDVEGPDAVELLSRLTTNNPAQLDPGESQYAAITDEDGIILDDTVIYRLGETEFRFIPNAGHDEMMTERWEHYRERWGLDATVENTTDDYGMIAVQGPDAVDIVEAAADASVSDLAKFEATETAVAGVETIVARTGYTGEDGFELILPTDGAQTVWSAIDGQPCGLGARDTLRLEMGFLLSGQDFHPEDNPRNPYEADIGFTVDLDTEFVGRDVLAQVAEEGVSEQFVGLELEQRAVARTGYTIETPDGDELGEITSGTMSPTLGVPIALGYIPVEYSDPGTELRVPVRGDPKIARVRETPFLDR